MKVFKVILISMLLAIGVAGCSKSSSSGDSSSSSSDPNFLPRIGM